MHCGVNMCLIWGWQSSAVASVIDPSFSQNVKLAAECLFSNTTSREDTIFFTVLILLYIGAGCELQLDVYRQQGCHSIFVTDVDSLKMMNGGVLRYSCYAKTCFELLNTDCDGFFVVQHE